MKIKHCFENRMATLTDVRLFAKFRKFGSMLSLDEMIFFLRKLKKIAFAKRVQETKGTHSPSYKTVKEYNNNFWLIKKGTKILFRGFYSIFLTNETMVKFSFFFELP